MTLVGWDVKHYYLGLAFVTVHISAACTVAVPSAPAKQPAKTSQPPSKPTSQSSVFVFKGAQAASAANGQTATTRPAGILIV